MPFTVVWLFLSNEVAKITFGLLAVGCFFTASYFVWRDQRRQYLSEFDRNNGAPRIEGKLTRLRTVARIDTVPIRAAQQQQQPFICDWDIFAETYLVNQSETPCTIKHFIGTATLDGHALQTAKVANLQDYEFSFVQPDGRRRAEDLVSLTGVLDGLAMQRGIGYRGWLRFELRGIRNTEVDQVQFGLVIVDSFDGRHEVLRRELEGTGEIQKRPGPRVGVL